MITAIFIFGSIGLIFGLILVVLTLQLNVRLQWLHDVLIPYFNNLAKFLNPDKK